MRLIPGGVLTVATAAGLHALSMAMPGSGQAHGWLQLLALAWLAARLVRETRQAPTRRQAWVRAGALGWLFATVWLGASFWWLYVSMHRFGGMPAVLAALAVLLLAAALATYYAAATALWAGLSWRALDGQRATSASASAGLFAACWTLAELMRGRWFTGFPWAASGYAHVDGWLVAWAPWIGVYGIGALAAALAMLLARRVNRLHAMWPLCGLLLVTGALHLWSPSWTHTTGHQSVELLQANIAQDDKFDPARGVREALSWYDERLRASQQTLVVAPETAIPVVPQQLAADYWQTLSSHFTAQTRSLALVGLPWRDEANRYSNAVLALGPASQTGYRYDKHHLVPFGEFIPAGFAWFVRQMQIPLGDFRSGAADQPSLVWAGQRLAPNICYEDVFGEELGRRFVQPELSPTVFINVSNIAWFGDTVAVPQHLNIARMRALEFERPMLRATNTGATAIIDHHGRVKDQLPAFARGTLVGQYEGRQGLTPYARWVAPWGLGPLWVLSALVLLVALVRRRF